MPLRRILLLFALAAFAWGHGSTEDIPPPEDPPPPPPGNGRKQDPRDPPLPPTWPGEPPPSTPGSGPPVGPHPNPAGPEPGQPGGRPAIRPEILTRPRTSSTDSGWRVWWEFNREELLGLRSLLRRKVTLTGPGERQVRSDPLGALRPQVLASLRTAARRDPEHLVRAAALIALGRMGADEDAKLMVDVLRDDGEPAEVREAAAVGLGILPPFTGEASLQGSREFVGWVLETEKALPERARGMVFLAAGLRARGDTLLRMDLLGRLAGGKFADGEEAAHLAFACGFAGDPIVVPELVRAALKGKLGTERLSDWERAHVVAALALTGDPGAVEPLARVLRSRRSGVDTRRSAALGLGRLLHEADLGEAAAEAAAHALRQSFEKENDTHLRGFCAVGLGAARTPQSLPLLMEAIDHGGNMGVKPYCALALGLAARALDDDAARPVRLFLREELDKTNHSELGAALSLALGLARDHESEKTLLERATRKSLPDPVRGAAAQALGLLGSASPEAIAALEEVVTRETSGRTLEDAVLALGLLGQRHVARALVDALPKTKVAQVQGRIMLALTYLHHSDSVAPLLEVLENRQLRSLVREFAAVALGLLGDRREKDLLFWGDAWFNLEAATRSTHEWVRLY